MAPDIGTAGRANCRIFSRKWPEINSGDDDVVATGINWPLHKKKLHRKMEKLRIVTQFLTIIAPVADLICIQLYWS